MRFPRILSGSAVLLGALIAAAPAFAQNPPAPAAQSANQSNEGPSEVVQNASQSILKALDADRDGYRKDPSKVAPLVDKYLVPHFDVPFAARLVLGQHWRTATPDQQKRFVDAFYRSLINNYGGALVDFTADRLKIYPTNVDANATRATVRTEIKRDDGSRVAVNYYMRKTAEGWKAWDVVIDGISYVNSYREDFGAQIDKQGLDQVIRRLESGEKPSEIVKNPASTKKS